MLQEIKNIIVKPSDTIEAAIGVIEHGSKRIALAVDEDMKLLGTITDGDIRGALLQHMSMDTPVKSIMNAQPKTALTSDSKELIISIMKKDDLLHVPIVDDEGILIGIETLLHLYDDAVYDNPVFIMAGGFGTRLYPLTKETPKPLLKVSGKPILETIIEQFIGFGFHNFYISTHFQAKKITDYFEDGARWNVKIKYVHEPEPLGTAGALNLLKKENIQLPFIMMNGDLLTKVNFEHLLAYHRDRKEIATMCVREYDFQVPYGVVKIDNHCVSGIVEKPVHNFFVNAGIYILDPEIFNCIHVDGYLDMPCLLEQQIEMGKKVNSFPIHEYWIDVGRIEEYERANTELKG